MKNKEMKNKIEYILLKLVQITAIVFLPGLIYETFNEPFSIENSFRFGFRIALLIYFTEELLTKELEKRLHGELY